MSGRSAPQMEGGNGADLMRDAFERMLRELKRDLGAATLDGDKVTGYVANAAKSVLIPPSATLINQGAFQNSGLKRVVFGGESKVRVIGRRAFEAAEIEDLDLPPSVEEIGVREGGALDECTFGSFYRCAKLARVQFSPLAGLKVVGVSAFRECVLLASIELPPSVDTIGQAAFCGCAALKVVSFGEGSRLAALGAAVFVGCTALPALALPAEVAVIPEKLCHGCSALREVRFLARARLSLRAGAFAGCGALAKLFFPGGLRECGAGAIPPSCQWECG